MGTHSGGKPANLQNLSAIIYVYSTPPVCVAAWIPHTNRVPQPGYSHANSILAALLVRIFILVFPSLACKPGSVAGDGSAVSTTASSVSHAHAQAEPI